MNETNTVAEQAEAGTPAETGSIHSPNTSMLIRLSENSESVVREEMRRRGLSTWWEDTFNDKERKRIAKKFKPPTMFARKSDDETFEVEKGMSDIAFLDSLAGPLFNKRDAYLAKKLLTMAELIVEDDTPVTELHVLYHHKIDLLFRLRKQERYAADLALHASLQQIKIAPEVAEIWKKEHDSKLPPHKGYNLLIAIKENQGKQDEAMELVEQARLQGWAGDWDARLKGLGGEEVEAEVQETTDADAVPEVAEVAEDAEKPEKAKKAKKAEKAEKAESKEDETKTEASDSDKSKKTETET